MKPPHPKLLASPVPPERARASPPDLPIVSHRRRCEASTKVAGAPRSTGASAAARSLVPLPSSVCVSYFLCSTPMPGLVSLPCFGPYTCNGRLPRLTWTSDAAGDGLVALVGAKPRLGLSSSLISRPPSHAWPSPPVSSRARVDLASQPRPPSADVSKQSCRPCAQAGSDRCLLSLATPAAPLNFPVGLRLLHEPPSSVRSGSSPSRPRPPRIFLPRPPLRPAFNMGRRWRQAAARARR